MDAIRTVYHPAGAGKSARITATMGKRKVTITSDGFIIGHEIAAAALCGKLGITKTFTTGRLPDSYVHVFQT